MSDFGSVLSAAQQLSEPERLQLIDALWDTVTPAAEEAFSAEWAHEIEQRVAELKSGTAITFPWSQVRDEALARLKHGQGN